MSVSTIAAAVLCLALSVEGRFPASMHTVATRHPIARRLVADDKGSCTAADQSLMASLPVDQLATTCSTECGVKAIIAPDCVTSCVMSNGFTEDCATCVGKTAHCVASTCMGECMMDPSSVECSDCAVAKCPGFDKCRSGPFVPLPLPDTCEAAVESFADCIIKADPCACFKAHEKVSHCQGVKDSCAMLGPMLSMFQCQTSVCDGVAPGQCSVMEAMDLFDNAVEIETCVEGCGPHTLNTTCAIGCLTKSGTSDKCATCMAEWHMCTDLSSKSTCKAACSEESEECEKCLEEDCGTNPCMSGGAEEFSSSDDMASPSPRGPDCPDVCTEEWDPVCGGDGKTYSNFCFFNIAACQNPALTLLTKGECGPPGSKQ